MTRGRIAKVAAALIGILFVGALLMRLNRPSLPEGPVAIVWDQETCEHCKMHIGDPRFAAQAQQADGTVFNFDDPGCLADYLESESLAPRALYFRDYDSDRWLSEADAGFLSADDSPMGYGLRAVAQDLPDAHDWAWAKQHALRRRPTQEAP